MRGEEFKAALKLADLNQGQFADAMGVHRTVIGRQCNADEVDRYWVYALAGWIAATSANQVITLVAKYNKESE